MIRSVPRSGYVLLLAAIFVLLGVAFVRAQTSAGDAASMQTSTQTSASPKNASINLASARKGVVKKVWVRTGDRVTRGQTLVELDPAELLGTLHEKQADLKIEQIKLDEMKNGTVAGRTAIDLAVARVDFENSKLELVDALQDAFTRADDAIHGKVDQFLTNATVSPTPVFTSYTNPRYTLDFPGKRLAIEPLLASWQADAGALGTSSDLESAIATTRRRIVLMRAFLDTAAALLAGVLPDANASILTIHNWRIDMTTARNSMNTASKNLTAAEKKWRDANAKLNVLANSTSDTQIAIQDARVKALQAQIEQYQSLIGQMTTTAPADGTIKKVKVLPGMFVPAGSTVMVFSLR